ncbi:MAG: alkaline phosphatase family protein [Phycisphaerales bacterium]|nr:MAG: alkaline phosphatase family protein [Phycisphaerales bacterium]
MPHPTAVLCAVGLTPSLIGEHCPRIAAFARTGALQRLQPVLPAVTCSVQSSMLTGTTPRQHGIVGNGWYNRELAEVQFWKQSNHLVRGEKVWEAARRRDPSVTCANVFWWYNMYSSVDVSVTPRPIYKADGRKLPDVYTHPPRLRESLQERLGTFPLFQFWGPGSSIRSTQWIADAAMAVHEESHPTLMLVYLPHLDYALQQKGPLHPDIAAEVRALDAVAGKLLDFFASRGVGVILLSEYGIEEVDDAVYVNRALREAGWLRVRVEDGLELLDPGASDVFAVADHQVAHVYVRRAADVEKVAALCRGVDGVDRVLDRAGQAAYGLDHERSGELVLVAAARRWFSYYYWLDDARAPDFARTVDIHRKPGYDPVELFLDPRFKLPKASIGWRLLKRRLGMRTLMDVIPLNAQVVRGSHGRTQQSAGDQPVLITAGGSGDSEVLPCTAVRDVILDHLFRA